VQRISIVGNSGSGKTTVAMALAAALRAPHLELDSVYHQADWQPLPTELFRARVAEFVATDAWVVDGNYSDVRDLIWARADTVIWLDLPRGAVMRQLVRRTLWRAITRTQLWNGNTEPWWDMFRIDPERSLLRWAWTRHATYQERYLAARRDPANKHLVFVRLASRADVARFVAGLPGLPSAPAQPPDPAAPAQAGSGGGAAGE
jgi:adenylate kinase family enzyme